jgi:hypothetical protein
LQALLRGVQGQSQGWLDAPRAQGSKRTGVSAVRNLGETLNLLSRRGLSTKPARPALWMQSVCITTMNSTRSSSPLSRLGSTLPRLGDQPAPEDGARDKGSKSQDQFEVWHHHSSLRRPSEWALMLQFDQRR